MDFDTFTVNYKSHLHLRKAADYAQYKQYAIHKTPQMCARGSRTVAGGEDVKYLIADTTTTKRNENFT